MADGGRSEVGRALAAVAKVLAPAAALSAALYYFGWARTDAAARSVGIDQSLLGYSTSDYVLRSVAPMFEPVGVALFVLLIVMITGNLVRSLAVKCRARFTVGSFNLILATALSLAAVLLCIGALRMGEIREQSPQHLSAGLIIASGALLWLSMSIADVAPGAISSAFRESRFAVTLLVTLLSIVAGFAVITREAFDDGAGSIAAFVSGLDELPEVLVSSDVPLDIEAPGTSTEAVQVGQSSDGSPLVRYRYRGLRLLTEANGRLFMVSAGFGTAGGGDGVIVVPQSEGLRIDFLRLSTP